MKFRLKKLFVIVLIFLPLIFSIPSIGTNQSVTDFSLTLNPGLSPYRFSTSQPTPNGSVNLFHAYLSYKDLYVSNDTIAPTTNYVNTQSLVNLTALMNSNSSFNVNDFNYFISNNSQFVLLSTYSATNGSQINIFNLKNNNSFDMNSTTTFKLGSITNLGNTSDVFFTFYNTTTYSIVRYNFTADTFSIFFNSTNISLSNKTILTAHEFALNNQFYVSLTSQNSTNGANVNTTIFILNSKGLVFNKTFTGLNINTFTTFENGLILYSKSWSTYYKYFYSTGSYTSFFPSFQNYYNATQLYPFDNNSFLLLNFNTLVAINILDNNANSFMVTHVYNFYISQLTMRAFIIQGTHYYLLKGIGNDGFMDFVMNNINTPPSVFLIQTTTTPTNNYSQSSYQTGITYSSTNSGNPLIALAVFILIIVIPILGVIVFIAKRKDRYYPPQRNNSYSTRNQYTSRYRTQTNTKYKYQFCRNCGTAVQPEDIFCQNCGNRL